MSRDGSTPRKTSFTDDELYDADPSSHAGIVLPDAEGEVAEAAARVLSGIGEQPMDSYIVEDAAYEVEKNNQAIRQQMQEDRENDEIHSEWLAENPDAFEDGIVLMDGTELTEEEAWANEIHHLGHDPREN